MHFSFLSSFIAGNLRSAIRVTSLFTVWQHIIRRITEVGKNFRLRILLVFVDDENLNLLRDLNKIAFASDFTMICAWSNLECARYLETFKCYEGKSSTSIQEKEESEFVPKLTKVLTNVKSVNKTDVLTLLGTFGNFANICRADEKMLAQCPGIGDKKVRWLHQTFNEPFIKRKQQRIADGEKYEDHSFVAKPS